MKKIFCLYFYIFLSNSVFASPNADEILKNVRDRHDGKDYFSNVVLHLKDGEDVRERELYMLQKDFEEDEQVLMIFREPADVRNVGFMMTTYPESKNKSDDQWMYFPAFRKIRRISAEDKRGSFMGSEFAYTDLDKVRVSDFNSTVVGEESILGRPTWVIERVPVGQDVINKTGYHKVKMYVDKERSIALKHEYFDAKGILFKEQLSEKVDKADGIWTILSSHVINHENGRESRMIFNDMAYDVGLPDKYFSRNSLKRGIRTSELAQLLNQ